MGNVNNIRLGKLPAKVDKRTIKLRSVIRKELLPDPPEIYDIDKMLGGVEDNNMYANNKFGCCVTSARAHQTLRFEKYEQGELIPITDQEVINQYFKESGGIDTGLYLLNSMKSWRNKGWIAGGKTYNIYAFASVDWKDHDEVKHCIHLLGGLNYGFMVPQSCLDQFKAGEVWSVVSDDGGLQGGHGVYAYKYDLIEGYNEIGPVCMTWGKRQQMTWEFWDKYVDEAYGIVDNKNDWMGDDSPVDVEKLQAYLDEITAGNEEENPMSDCPIAKAYVGAGNFLARLFGRRTRILPPVRNKF